MSTNVVRAVLLTGATGGVGTVAARKLAERGFLVFAGVRRLDADLPNSPNIRPIQLDVTDERSIAAAAADLASQGVDALHGLVNNAGIIVQGPIELVPPDEMRRQFEVNVYGPAMLTRAMLPLLRAGHGRVVNLSAPTARVPGPFFGPISASKAAVQAISDALRLELEPWGIRVVIIEPGTLETQIFAKAATAAKKSMAAQPADQVLLYQQQIDTVAAALAKIKASPPSIAADAIVTALTARKPKPRYTVGPDVRLIGLISRLPLRTRDRMMRSVTGLAKLKLAD